MISLIIGKVPENVSKTHKELLKILSKIKPHHKIFCEYPVRKLFDKLNETDNSVLIKAKHLSFDFYDDTGQIIFEIQGGQHDRFNQFFHKNFGGFDRQRRNDSIKNLICMLTNIKLIKIKSDIKLTEKIVLEYYKGVDYV